MKNLCATQQSKAHESSFHCCTILTINTTVKIGNMATNPVSIHLNKVIDTGQVHSEDQWRGIDLDRGIATTVKIIQDRQIHLLPESCNEMVNITRMLARKKEQANFLYSRWSKSEQRTVIWAKLPYINISLLKSSHLPRVTSTPSYFSPPPAFIWEVEGAVFWF